MINLKNGYVITSDGKSYTLAQYVLQESKDGNVTEVKKYGLFRNVPDNVPINEILRNCEVTE